MRDACLEYATARECLVAECNMARERGFICEGCKLRYALAMQRESTHFDSELV